MLHSGFNSQKEQNPKEQTKMKHKKLVTGIGITIPFLVLMSVVVGFNTIAILGATEDSAVGTVTVGNSAPTVDDTPDIVNAAYGSVSAIDPDDSTIFGVNITISDGNTLADLDNVTFYIYDDSQHGGDYDSASASEFLTKVVWEESTDVWSITQEGSQWNENSPQDPGSASSATSYEFCFRFQASKATRADTDWNVTVHVYDDQEATDNGTRGSFFTVNNYFEISWDVGTFAWGTVAQDVTNDTMVTNRTITIYANAQWEITVSASNFTSGVETPVNCSEHNIIILDADGVEGGTDAIWVTNATLDGPGDWNNQAPMDSETGFTRTSFFWFNDPAANPFTLNEEYSVTVYTGIAAED